MTYVALTALALIALSFPIYFWARFRTEQLAQSSADLDEAYAAAQALIRDPKVPEPVVDFVARFAELAGRPALARMLCLDIISGRFSEDRKPGSDAEAAFRAGLKALDAGQARTFARFVGYTVFSSAGASALLAPIYRRVFVFGLMSQANGAASPTATEPAKAQTLAVDLSPRVMAARHIDLDCVAA